ncbi:MAG: SagB/ThcOx family dehydrogenase [Candidatus Hermodarchaeota archaeon]
MEDKTILKLSEPLSKGNMSLEEVFKLRTTVREFSSEEIDFTIISQLLWALQGSLYTESLPSGELIYHRIAPSAGKSYPLEVYAVLSTGLYHYEVSEHALHLLSEKDVREALSEAVISPINKAAIKTTPLTIVLAMDNQKALKATPIMENSIRYVHLEAGHATQNLILQAACYGLGVCTITSYQLGPVYESLELPREHRPIYLLPIGFPKRQIL